MATLTNTTKVLPPDATLYTSYNRELKLYSPRQGESSNRDLYNRVVVPDVSLSHRVVTQQNEEATTAKTLERAKWTNVCLYSLPCTLAYVFFVVSALLLWRASSADSFVSVNNPKIASASLVLDNVRSNLRLPPLAHLQSAPSHTACEEASDTLVKVSVGQWSGTTRGCICSDSQQHSFGACVLNFWDCYFLPHQNAQTLYKWESGQKYCAQETQSWSNTLRCTGATSKKCFDDVCVPQSQDCPDNALTQVAGNTQTQTESGTRNAQQSTATYLQAGKHRFSAEYETPDATSTPFVQLTTSTGKAPCLNPSLAPKTESGLSYALSRQQAIGCDEYGDLSQYVKILDQIPQHTFYETNKNLWEKVIALPLFAQSQSTLDTVQLMAVRRVYVQATEECLGFQGDDLEEFADYSRLAAPLLIFYTWVLLIVAAFVFVAGFMYALVVANMVVTGFEWEKQRTRQVYNGLGLTLVVISIFQCVSYRHIVTNHLGPVATRMRAYITAECTQDAGVQLAVTRLLTQIDETQQLFAEPMFFQFFVSTLYVFLWIAVSRGADYFASRLVRQHALYPKQ